MKQIPKTASSPPQPLLTIRQAATQLQVSVRTIRRLIDAETLPVLRIGRSVRIRPENLATLLKSK